jgi:FixJ family two-component response regulator
LDDGIVDTLASLPQYTMEYASPKQPREVVYLVDDDAHIREAIAESLETVQLNVISFDSAASFLRHERSESAGCLVLDLQLPDMNGLELQEQLGHQPDLPIIFITGRGDIPSSVRAMKAGAIEFLTKPLDPDALIATIRAALDRDRNRRERQAELAGLHHRYALLSPREREVLNKQAAAMLGITLVTLQIHRGQIMRKMLAPSFAELVRMCQAIGISGPESKCKGSNSPAAPSPHRTNDTE